MYIVDLLDSNVKLLYKMLTECTMELMPTVQMFWLAFKPLKGKHKQIFYYKKAKDIQRGSLLEMISQL